MALTHTQQAQSAIETIVSRARHERFTQDALEPEREILATGLGHEWSYVRAYFTQMAAFRAGRADRPAPLVPKQVA